MTEQEAKDLEQMKQDISEIKKECFSFLDFLTKATPKQLEESGYRNQTTGDAMLIAFRSFQTRVKLRERAYLVKYPD
jgi:hypothetical protein